ncbi:MAG TPA: phosphocholine cytidylyltransferase family protein [Candidatus Omnitrophota bacterium]|nr:phosphocholine cytidylyltransferase family protein [Candidatus Omnitrophota bacterium]
MKAIVIAAGRAKRMKHLSEDLPKCLFEVNGRPVLRRQMDTFKACGICDIVVVKGYKQELINYPDARYYINDDFMNNNILNSLFYAETEITGDCIITYGDILFNEDVVKRLIAAKADIAAVCDIEWEKHYENRHAHPITEAENVFMDGEHRLVEIGKIMDKKHAANAEFIGMIKVSAAGAKVLTSEFNRVKRLYSGRPFKRAGVFAQAYLTDMLQELVDRGHRVDCVAITDGWMELDTPDDYAAAAKAFA